MALTPAQSSWTKRHADVIRKSRASKTRQNAWHKLISEGKTRQATSELKSYYEEQKAKARKRSKAYRTRILVAKAMRITAQRLNGELEPDGLSTQNVEVQDRKGPRRWNAQILWRREGESDWHATHGFGSNLGSLDDEDILRGWNNFGQATGIGSDTDLENAHEAVVVLYGEGYQK